MAIVIRAPKNIEEIKQGVNIYISQNEENFIPSDRKAAVFNACNHWKRGSFVRVIESNDIIVGIIVAVVLIPEYSIYSQLYSCYYTTNLKGYSAVSALKLTHEAMIKYAEESGIAFIVVQSNFFDDRQKLPKILEKFNWHRRNHGAVWRTSHAPKT